jgi:hypothetical protein
VEQFSGASFYVRVLGLINLPLNIRLGWKGLPGTNALAYFAYSSVQRYFLTLSYCKNVLKLFEYITNDITKKLECLHEVILTSVV